MIDFLLTCAAAVFIFAVALYAWERAHDDDDERA